MSGINKIYVVKLTTDVNGNEVPRVYYTSGKIKINVPPTLLYLAIYKDLNGREYIYFEDKDQLIHRTYLDESNHPFFKKIMDTRVNQVLAARRPMSQKSRYEDISSSSSSISREENFPEPSKSEMSSSSSSSYSIEEPQYQMVEGYNPTLLDGQLYRMKSRNGKYRVVIGRVMESSKGNIFVIPRTISLKRIVADGYASAENVKNYVNDLPEYHPKPKKPIGQRAQNYREGKPYQGQVYDKKLGKKVDKGYLDYGYIPVSQISKDIRDQTGLTHVSKYVVNQIVKHVDDIAHQDERFVAQNYRDVLRQRKQIGSQKYDPFVQDTYDSSGFRFAGEGKGVRAVRKEHTAHFGEHGRFPVYQG
jgi:hypothetical protein